MARADISERVAALGDLSRSDLIDLWIKQYGIAPPSGVRQPLLLRAAARHTQEKQLGGLSSNCKRLLKVALKRVARPKDAARVGTPTVGAGASEAEDDSLAGTAIEPTDLPLSFRAVPSPGARLIREWNGRRYVVEVIDSGFVMDGKVHRSLTAIAFLITGAKWSGPRFFGL